MKITDWVPQCRKTCLPFPCGSVSVESPVFALQPNIPEVYHDRREFFSKTHATCLHPNHPCDCVIDLLAGSAPTFGRIYPLSVAETKAMEEYIQEALQQGFIRTSTSLASAGYFFVAKKDGGLGPCIDYRNLNSITTMYRYPFPLVPDAIEQLCRAWFFNKLDLRSACNLIRTREEDESKTDS